MYKIILTITLFPFVSFANINSDNFYKENEYDLNGIAHCKGFLQGIVDIFDYFDNEYSELIIENSTEEEIEEFSNFQKEVNNFNNVTGDELNFQLEMKCGKDNQCRAEYANIVIKGFEQGFGNMFMLYETDGDGFNDYAERYFESSDIFLEMCFNKADG